MQVYDPVDHYDLLATDSGPEAVLQAFLQRSSPHLRPDVVSDLSNRIVYIMTLREVVRDRFKAILKKMGINGETLKILDSKSHELPAIEDVVEAVSADVRDSLRAALTESRDDLAPDVLAQLGFAQGELPNSFLHEDIPEWADHGRKGVLQGLDFESMNMGQVQHLLQGGLLQQLLWMQHSKKAFQECISRAYEQVTQIRKALMPPDQINQPYELSTDLGSKSLIELLEILMNSKLEPRRRIDAFQVLRYAIGLFSVHNSPVFQGRLIGKSSIDQKMNITEWTSNIEYQNLPVEAVEINPANGKPVFGLCVGGIPKNGVAVARRLRESSGIRTILSKYSDIIRNSDFVVYGSRAKGDASSVLKMVLVQERVNQYLAKRDGMNVPSVRSKNEANRKLRKYRKQVMPYQGTLSLRARQTCYETLDDIIGVEVMVDLQKPLREYSAEGSEEVRVKIDECFRHTLLYLAKNIGLVDCKPPENNLWRNRTKANAKRDPDFRDMKMHGFVVVQTEQGEVKVPVELRIQPMDVFLRTESPGSSACKQAYQDRKKQNLGDVFLPASVGGQVVYPRTWTDGPLSVDDTRADIVEQIFRVEDAEDQPEPLEGESACP